MNEFILAAPNEAALFLRAFPADIRRRGEQYFRQGAVSDLRCVEAGSSFEATVEGSESYETTLTFLDDEGWVDDCSCPFGTGCKHAYAMMKKLLTAHVEAVREAPAGSPTAPSQTKAPRFVEVGTLTRRPTPEPPPPAGSLHEIAVKALGRPLQPDELRFVTHINALYRRILVTQGVFPNDLTVLGFPAPKDTWNRVELWPSPPMDEHELWLYLAMYLEEHGRAVPEFLRPVSDLTRIRDRVQRWRRGREVERWRKMLEHAQPGDLFDEARADVDLRLRFAAKEMTLEWRAGAEMEFAPFKSMGAFRGFDQTYSARLLPEAMLIWNGFRQRAEYGHHGNLTYNESDCVRILLPMLRQPLLAGRLVGANGQPLQRPAEPLRWSLNSATEDQSDYGLRLVQADGSPAPPLILVVGKFYLSADTLFIGPPLDGRVLNPSAENRIPAAALETRTGLRFLNALKVPLPARLESRIQRVAITARVRCELQPTYPGSDNDVCVVQFLADAADGSRAEHWAYNGWEGMSARPEWAPAGTKPKKESENLVVYERAGLPDCAGLLAPLGAKWDFQRNGWQVRVTKKFPEVFVPWLKGLPPTLAVELRGELATFLQAHVSGEVKLEVSEAGMDWFDLQVVVNVSDTELTPEEIKLLLNAKGKWVRLGAKGWRKLDFNLTEEDDSRLAKLGLTPRELSAEPQRLHALQLADDAAKRFLPEEQFERVQRRARELQARVTPDVPAEIKGELRPYQRDGFHFLAYLSSNHFGGILADDMGLGKTLQALCWLAWLRQLRNEEGGVRNEEKGSRATNNAKLKTPNPKPCLVVCPKSVTDNWRAESERFLPGLRVKVWRGNEVGTLPEHTQDADLHVLNYAQLRIVGEALSQVDFLAIILDEGQFIKNPSSITAQIARTLRGEHRLVLSGTPIENRLMDLWSLMSFAMPGALGSRAEFGRLFDGKDDPFARPRLAARVRPFLLRRTKTQVAKDLPDRVEEDLFCELEGEQKTLYRAELKRAQQFLLKVTTQKQLNKDRFHLLTSLLRLRQICCHPKLVKPDSKAASAKVEALMEQLEPLMEEGQKVLVFSQFVELLGLLSAELKARKWREFYLAGDTENRGELVREFQSAEGAGVFLISLKAGGFGLNLTAASYVVLFDPWWNPAVENQAIDRTHRIGQVNKVIAYRLLIKDSIEEKIRALQTKKNALAADVLGEEKFSQSLTLDDLRFLFAD